MRIVEKRETCFNMSLFFGGDKRDRTADLLTASQALSQLSYTPRELVCDSQNIFMLAQDYEKVKY